MTITSAGVSSTIACTAGSSGGDGSVTVNSCAPTLSANPSTIDVGETSTLKWSKPAACSSSCVFSDGYAVSGTSGTYTLTPPTPSSGNTDPYALTCTPSGSGSPYVTQTDITVKVPTAAISATPNRVKSGGSSTVSWNAANVNTCTITRNGTPWQALTADASRAISGSITDTITGQTTYLMQCFNNSGSGTARATATAVANIIPATSQF